MNTQSGKIVRGNIEILYHRQGRIVVKENDILVSAIDFTDARLQSLIDMLDDNVERTGRPLLSFNCIAIEMVEDMNFFSIENIDGSYLIDTGAERMPIYRHKARATCEIPSDLSIEPGRYLLDGDELHFIETINATNLFKQYEEPIVNIYQRR